MHNSFFDEVTRSPFQLSAIEGAFKTDVTTELFLFIKIYVYKTTNSAVCAQGKISCLWTPALFYEEVASCECATQAKHRSNLKTRVLLYLKIFEACCNGIHLALRILREHAWCKDFGGIFRRVLSCSLSPESHCMFLDCLSIIPRVPKTFDCGKGECSWNSFSILFNCALMIRPQELGQEWLTQRLNLQKRENWTLHTKNQHRKCQKDR